MLLGKICYLCSDIKSTVEYYSNKLYYNRMTGLDNADIAILRALQDDGKLTVKELGDRAHLSTTPTFERLKRLEREGYIRKYVALADTHKVGNSVVLWCNIRLKQHTHDYIKEFMDAVQDIDEITDCYNTSGDYDFLIKIHVRDMAAYQDFMLNTLGRMHCLGSLNSVFIIGEVKHTTAVPVRG